MSAIFKQVICFTTAAWILTACNDPATSSGSSAASSNAPSSAIQYGQRGSDNTWPHLPESPNTSGITGEKLAANYLIVFDGSGSMEETGCTSSGNRLSTAKKAVLDFMTTIPSGSNLGLYAFDKLGTGPRLPIGQHSEQNLSSTINALAHGGGTPLKDAINQGANMLTLQAQSQLGYGEYHLVVVTDGSPSTGQDPTYAIQNVTSQTAINIHTIGFCLDETHPLNQQGVTSYYSAHDEQSLKKGLSSVLAEAPSFDVDSFGGDNNG